MSTEKAEFMSNIDENLKKVKDSCHFWECVKVFMVTTVGNNCCKFPDNRICCYVGN